MSHLLTIALAAALLVSCASGGTTPPPTEAPGITTPVPSPASTPTPTETPEPVVTFSPTPSPSPTPQAFPFIRSAPARIAVPAVGIDLPIQEGVDCDTAPPTGVAVHLAGTAQPGQGSNAYFYGQPRGGSFIGLWDAQVAMAVRITFQDGSTADYEVTTWKDRVLPGDIRWLLPTEAEQITLQTSSGLEAGLPKVIVVAKRTR